MAMNFTQTSPSPLRTGRRPEPALAGLGLLAVAAAFAAWLMAPGAASLVVAAGAGAGAVGLAWVWRARRDVQAHHSQLVDHRRQIGRLEERLRAADERDEQARALQDAVAQTQFAAYLQAGTLARAARQGGELASMTWAEPLAALERLNRCALAEARLLRFELGPPEACRGTLAERLQPAIDALVSRSPELIVHSRLQLDDALAPAIRGQLARLALAALHSAQSHGGASELTIEWTAPADAPARLHIVDDGEGFDPARAGSDLRRMREQALSIGAELRIDSAPGRGTDILLVLPA